MINIKDIAKECDVNPATVSRAINGKKGVSEKMRSKILHVAESMGYSKNPLAASLITHKSGIIGLVVPDITNPYYASVAQGVSTVMRSKGYSTFLCDAQRSRQQELQYFGMLCAYRVEGVILLSVTAKSEDLKIFREKNIRVVCVDNPIAKDFSSVINDNFQGAWDMTGHLIKDCKVKRLVCLMGNPEAETTRQRMRGCTEALERFNAKDNLIAVINIDSEYEAAYRTMDKVLSFKPDCVFAVNDTVALGVFSYCMNHGINVPQELKIAGFDDIAAASMISVPLTTVHQRKFVLGQKAATQLLTELAISDPLPMRIELLPKLKIRSSCGEQMQNIDLK